MRLSIKTSMFSLLFQFHQNIPVMIFKIFKEIKYNFTDPETMTKEEYLQRLILKAHNK